MGNVFDRIGLTMGKVIGRIDVPGIPGTWVVGLADAVQRRVAHVDIGMAHIDFSAQDITPFLKLTRPHASKQSQRFLGWAITIRRVFTWLL